MFPTLNWIIWFVDIWFLELFIYFYINPLWDMELVNIFPHSVCRLPLCLVDGVLYRGFLVSWDLFYLSLILVLYYWCCVQKVVFSVSVFKIISSFLLYWLQCVWFCAFYPLGLEICAWWKIGIYLHSFTCRPTVWPSSPFSGVYFRVCVLCLDLQFDLIDQSVCVYAIPCNLYYYSSLVTSKSGMVTPPAVFYCSELF